MINDSRSTVCPTCKGLKDKRAYQCHKCAKAITLANLPPCVIDIKTPTELGRKDLYHRHALVKCIDCGQQRWIQIRRLKSPSFTGRCAKCEREYQFGANHPLWKGYRMSGNGLYRMVLIYPDSAYYCMAKASTTIHGGGRYVMEHRLTIAKHLGRPLMNKEHVHHLNGDRRDNHLNNLQLISPKDHAVYTHMCAKCELRVEIRLLKWQIKQLQQQLQYKLDPEGSLMAKTNVKKEEL